MIPSFSLEGKTAIVTGGKRGIGKAIALAFAEAGADVAVCSRVIEDGQLQTVAEEIKRIGRRSLVVQADVTRKTDVDNLVQRLMNEFGRIDILVNNAAVMVRKPLLELSEDDWDTVIDTNLKGYHLCCQAVGKIMINQKRGNIINMASAHGVRAFEGRGAYPMAKAGVFMLTGVLAKELARYGIRVNGIAPGVVRTEMSHAVWSDSDSLKRMESTIPLGRLAEPSDIVGAALLLASDASSYITGHTIMVDGGRSL